ncbi:hypothetical protein IQ276_019040 [Desmonostoc muscorum LEGE 12446]|uniref:Uncharacterized protein n=1 Tax=Desmonostoc muscorum LEGE 12446 TaxID=1828758 RepID=A0A8J7A1S0_DESMC|nr:hypothetical protein [Desmonostoc muscorum]MCF2148484.1 hypothetical protein [Desmonostoc muscorum LEGE 12446]
MKQEHSHLEQERSRLEQEHSHLEQERSHSEHEKPSSEHERPSLSDRTFQFDRGTLCTKLAYSGFWERRSRIYAKSSRQVTVRR